MLVDGFGRGAYSNVVDPDQVGVVNGDTVSTPDVLGVDVGDGNVLDDNVSGAANEAQTLTLDHTGRAFTEDGLVRVDGDTEGTGVVAAETYQLARSPSRGQAGRKGTY